MTALWSSFAVVALAEMGDKTQLIAFSLTMRYRRPWIVMLGILIATVLNHALAATVGVWLARLVPPRLLALVLGLTLLRLRLWGVMPVAAGGAGGRPGPGAPRPARVIFFLPQMGGNA